MSISKMHGGGGGGYGGGGGQIRGPLKQAKTGRTEAKAGRHSRRCRSMARAASGMRGARERRLIREAPVMFRPGFHPRGSVMTLAIVVSVVLTGLIVSLAWVASAQVQATSRMNKIDQAFFAAEAGVQRVQWYCKYGKLGSISSPLNGSINGFNYSVSWSTVSGTTIRIRSVGSSGNVSYTLSETATPPSSAPALATGGHFQNKNIDIVGNIVVGSYDNANTGSLTGNLTYATSATNTGFVTGSITQDATAFTPIDMDALGLTLIAAAGKTYAGDQTNVVFDFTTLSGTNKVIYVAGNVTNPAFTGSGTLYVSGSLSANNFGTAANPVSLVARGDISLGNNVIIYGGLYTGGALHRGKFNITGIVYTALNVDDYSNPQSYLTFTSAPWFDPRAATWNPTTSVTNFAGPLP
jgi:hypothetical protein